MPKGIPKWHQIYQNIPKFTKIAILVYMQIPSGNPGSYECKSRFYMSIDACHSQVARKVKKKLFGSISSRLFFGGVLADKTFSSRKLRRQLSQNEEPPKKLFFFSFLKEKRKIFKNCQSNRMPSKFTFRAKELMHV
jgi:hypothetical protein